MTLAQLLEQHGIGVAQPGHAHYKEGWTHICCPHCNEQPGSHPFPCSLGFPDGSWGGRCFKCGKHNLIATLRAVLRCSWEQAREFAKQVNKAAPPARAESWTDGPLEEVPLPGTSVRHDRHVQYLLDRKYRDPDKLVVDWGLRFSVLTPPCWSIVVPICDEDGRSVSWQARDITGLAKTKYKTMPGVNVKNLLYGLHLVPRDQRSIIVVEGVTDAWRIGAGYAVATLGVDWTSEQLLLLHLKFSEVYILFDNETGAEREAHRLHDALETLGTDAFVMDWVWEANPAAKDPGELTDNVVTAMRRAVFQ